MNSNKKNILIIDDDDRNIFALKAVLSAKKFTCITATGAAKALEILNGRDDIDAALVDMMMPDMDGYELMGIIRKNKAHDNLKLIAVTAQAMPGDREKCLAAGADDYISKPVNVDRLLDLFGNAATQQ